MADMEISESFTGRPAIRGSRLPVCSAARVGMGRLFGLLLLLLVAGRTLTAQEAWQTSYDVFCQELDAFFQSGQDISVWLAKYSNKEATWDGVFAGVTDSPFGYSTKYANINLPRKTVTYGGHTAVVFPPTLTLTSAQVPTWTAVPVGTAVRFKVRFDPSEGLFGQLFLIDVREVTKSSVIFLSMPGDLVQTMGALPVITASVNGASFQDGMTSGSWITIIGANLSNSTRIWNNSDFNGNVLPKSLDGVSVQINGKDAPVYYISPTQLNVLAPIDATTGYVEVKVIAPGGIADANGTLLGVAPAFFRFTPNNGKYIAAVHGDGVYVCPAGLFGDAVRCRPVKAGDVVMLFGTAFGPTDPAYPVDTILAAALSLAAPVHVQIGGIDATVQFAGMVSNGLYQLNVVIPAGLAPGDQSVVAETGGQQSSGGSLTVAN